MTIGLSCFFDLSCIKQMNFQHKAGYRHDEKSTVAYDQKASAQEKCLD